MMRNRMPLMIVLGWRNLWRHPRRTIVMLFAITLGIWFMVISAAMMRGVMEQQLHSTIYDLTGHAQIHTVGYRDDPAIEHSMPVPSESLLGVLKRQEVKQWAARVRLPAIVVSERESRGVILLGIDPLHEKGLSFIGDPVVAGRGLESMNDTGIIIGRRMAEKLETRIGKRIVVMSQDKDNEIADRGFRIVGLFQAELAATETAYIFTGLTTAQKMLGMGNDISEISLITSSREGLDPLVARLKVAAPHLESLSWQQLQPLIVSAMKVYDTFMIVWFLIIFSAMAFGLTNTMLMSVFERTRELGLFQALGMRPRFIVGHVMIESFILLVTGISLGIFAAWLTTLALVDGIDLSAFAQGMEQFHMASVLYFDIQPPDILKAAGLVLLLGLLASLYPAMRAARFVPVEAITRI